MDLSTSTIVLLVLTGGTWGPIVCDGIAVVHPDGYANLDGIDLPM